LRLGQVRTKRQSDNTSQEKRTAITDGRWQFAPLRSCDQVV
jgi:hypothetical protein